MQKHEKNWAQMSDSHPWVRIFNKANADTRNVLVRLAIDVYNDSLVETLSARSWPSRSLSCEYANYILDKFDKSGWDTADISFNTTSSMCHYRSPIIYAEMLEVIGDLVRREVCKTLQNSLCYSVQIDGSMDRQQQDSKFVTARHVQENEVSVQTVFVGIVSSDKSGAEGLLDALCTSIVSLESKQSDVVEEACETNEVIMKKLVGISTDGESANTGKKGGLWQLLKEKLKRNLITVWCVCHRSDLALESVQSSVPELRYWMADVTAVATFFRVSARRTKELHKVKYSMICYFHVLIVLYLLYYIHVIEDFSLNSVLLSLYNFSVLL